MKKIQFIKESLRNIKEVGTILPSSKYVVAKMIAPINFRKKLTILELGSGSGVITKKLLEKSNKGVIYQDLKACSEYDSGLKSAAEVSATTLLILGKKDYLTPPFKAKELITAFKGPLIKEIKDSGHTLMVESPNKVLDYLIEIL